MNAENTFRVLKDEETFVERWQCRIGWHRWAKWSVPAKKGGEIYYVQNRACVDCGHAEIRQVTKFTL